MNIIRISLCQNESWILENLPRSLDSDYKPCYDFKYPFSAEIALDCERIVYKLNEYSVSSDICWHLTVTFINSDVVKNSELVDFIAYSQSKMRFVNIAKDASIFNSMNPIEKRRFILNSVCSAIMLVTNDIYHDTIKRITNEVLEFADNTECVLLEKRTKKYNAIVIFKSSLKGYDAKLKIKNNLTNKEEQSELLVNGTYADLKYKIYKIVFKGGKCVIQPKNDYLNRDIPIIVDLF